MTTPASGQPTLGLSIYPRRNVSADIGLATLAEDLGYTNLWFGDSQNIWREAYTVMGAVSSATTKIIVGTGVTNGVTRHTSVIASAWATLHELTDGRVAAGFGIGDSALHTMGMSPMKVAALGDLARSLRTLWSGETVESGSHTYRLAYLNQPAKIPIYMAASGPKLLHLAGEVADGVILLVGTDCATIRSALTHVEAGALSVGRSLSDIHVVLWAPSAIGNDPGEARDRVRAHVARTVLRPIQADLSDEELGAVRRIRDSYDYYSHMVPGSAHSKLVTDTLVDRFALAGTAEECRERVLPLSDAGIDQIAIIPFPGAQEDVETVVRKFAALAN